MGPVGCRRCGRPAPVPLAVGELATSFTEAELTGVRGPDAGLAAP
ncbi:hypothetical protein [Jiangella aurantiaca]|nr:hypothetical protein [Jiangella aurantiaca]